MGESTPHKTHSLCFPAVHDSLYPVILTLDSSTHQRISPPSEIPRSQLMKAVDDWGEKYCSTALAKERMTTHRTPSRPERKLEARWFLGDSDFVDRMFFVSYLCE